MWHNCVVSGACLLMSVRLLWPVYSQMSAEALSHGCAYWLHISPIELRAEMSFHIPEMFGLLFPFGGNHSATS